MTTLSTPPTSSPLSSLPAPLSDDIWIVRCALGVLTVALLTAGMSRAIGGLKPGEWAIGLLAVLTCVHILRRRLTVTLSTTAIIAGCLVLLGGTIIPLAILQWRGDIVTTDAVRGLASPLLLLAWIAIYAHCRIPPYLLIWTVILATTAVAAIGLLQVAHVPGIGQALIRWFPSYQTLEAVHLRRATSVVGGWEPLAALCAYGLIACFVLPTADMNRRTSSLLAACIVILCGGLLATQSVSVMLVTALVLAWFWVRYPAALQKRVLLVALLVGGLALLPLFIARVQYQFAAHSLITASPYSGNHLPQTWATRWLHWQVVFDCISATPGTRLFGIGPVFTYPVRAFNSTESFYWLLLYRGGIVYLVCFLLATVAMVSALRQRYLDAAPAMQPLLVLAQTVGVMVLLLGITDAHLFAAGEAQLAGALLGAALGADTTTRYRFVRDRLHIVMRGIQTSLIVLVCCGSLLTIGSVMAHQHGVVASQTQLDVHWFGPVTPTMLENQQRGTIDWQLPARNDATAVQGYAASMTAYVGSELPIYVTARQPLSYTLTVYRMGWYDGLGGRQMWQQTDLTTQPHSVGIGWSVACNIPIGADWTPGVYLIRLGSPQGSSYIPLVVTDAHVAPATTVVVLPTLTWQVANIWGNPPALLSTVALHRPLVEGSGAGDLLVHTLYFVRWMERAGYPVTYVTDTEAARNPALLQSAHNVIVAGMMPYRPAGLTTALNRIQASGTHIVWLGSSTRVWDETTLPVTDGADTVTLQQIINRDDIAVALHEEGDTIDEVTHTIFVAPSPEWIWSLDEEAIAGSGKPATLGANQSRSQTLQQRIEAAHP